MADILTRAEAAEYLRISTSSLDRLIKADKIPSFKAGRARLFNKEKLLEWAENGGTEQ